MKNQNPHLFQVVSSYLDTVKTKSGIEPTQLQKQNFLLECISYDLNPIKKQAYLVGYDKKVKSKDGSWSTEASFTTIIGIQGLTSIANKSGVYAGVTQPRFSHKPNGELDTCTITVKKIVQGLVCEFSGQAYFDERVQMTEVYENGKSTGKFKPNEGWSKQPKTLLEKCAKASALRNAFPEILGDKYIIDEMAKSDILEVKNEVKYITQEQIEEFRSLIKKASTFSGKAESEIENSLINQFNFQTIEEVYEPYATKIIEQIKARIQDLELSTEVEAIN